MIMKSVKCVDKYLQVTSVEGITSFINLWDLKDGDYELTFTENGGGYYHACHKGHGTTVHCSGIEKAWLHGNPFELLSGVMYGMGYYKVNKTFKRELQKLADANNIEKFVELCRKRCLEEAAKGFYSVDVPKVIPSENVKSAIHVLGLDYSISNNNVRLSWGV